MICVPSPCLISRYHEEYTYRIFSSEVRWLNKITFRLLSENTFNGMRYGSVLLVFGKIIFHSVPIISLGTTHNYLFLSLSFRDTLCICFAYFQAKTWYVASSKGIWSLSHLFMGCLRGGLFLRTPWSLTLKGSEVTMLLSIEAKERSEIPEWRGELFCLFLFGPEWHLWSIFHRCKGILKPSQTYCPLYISHEYSNRNCL